MKHYHVNVFSGDGTGVAFIEYVYRRRSDAEAALEDARHRAKRPDTPFTPEDALSEGVRECEEPGCVGEDG